MFNPYRHLRTAACVVLILSSFLSNPSLVILGFILMATGTIGGIDLAERRIEALEEKEKDNYEKTQTPEDN